MVKNIFLKLLCITSCISTALLSIPITFIAPARLASGTFTIGTPGLYVLSDDATTTAIAISINADNVILDLNGKRLSTSAVASLIIFTGTAARRNIVVKNGYLSGTTTNAIDFNNGPSTDHYNVTLQNLAIDSATGIGIDVANVRLLTIEDCKTFNGSTGLNIVSCQNVFIRRSKFIQTTVSGQATGMLVNGLLNLQVTDCDFSSNNATATGPGLGVDTSGTNVNWFFDSCRFDDNASAGANAAAGVRLAGIYSNFSFKNCSFSRNSNSSSGNAVGFLTTTSGNLFTFNDCIFDGNSANTGASRGMDLGFTATHTGWNFKNCVFRGNNSTAGTGGAAGMYLVDTFPITFLMENCNFDRQSALGGSSFGLQAIGGATFIIKNCTFCNNQSTSAAGTGSTIGASLLDGGMSFRGWVIRDSIFTRNITASTSTSGLAAGLSLRMTTTPSSIELYNCSFSNNATVTGEVQGLYLQGVLGLTAKQCVFNANSTRGLVASGVRSLAGTINSAYFEDCIANNNYANAVLTTGTCAGFNFSAGTADTCYFLRCVADGNAAISGTGDGFNFVTTGTNFIENCRATRNTSRGFVDAFSNAPPSNCYRGNIALGNGSSNFSGIGITAGTFTRITNQDAYPLPNTILDGSGLMNVSIE